MADVRAIVQEIDEALAADPSRAQGVKAIYQFDLDGGDTETYQLILSDDKNYAVEGEEETPDCTLKMSSEDFAKMALGELNGTKAFMSGRLKIKGNMGLALKLQNILSSYNTAKK